MSSAALSKVQGVFFLAPWVYVLVLNLAYFISYNRSAENTPLSRSLLVSGQ